MGKTYHVLMVRVGGFSGRILSEGGSSFDAVIQRCDTIRRMNDYGREDPHGMNEVPCSVSNGRVMMTV